MTRRFATRPCERLSSRYERYLDHSPSEFSPRSDGAGLAGGAFRLAFPFRSYDRRDRERHRKCRAEEALRKAASLTAWLEAILHLYGRRVLSLDTPIARTAGHLDDFARSAGMSPGFADIAIAATASTHGLIILTRNLRHFQPLGLSVLDPLGGSLP
jgi:hypothetical protein